LQSGYWPEGMSGKYTEAPCKNFLLAASARIALREHFLTSGRGDRKNLAVINF